MSTPYRRTRDVWELRRDAAPRRHLLRRAAAFALWTAAALIATASANDALRFVEETADSGVAHRYVGGWEHYVGGGVAAFDCTGDGLPELAFAGGENPSALYENVGAPGGPLRFERLDRSNVSVRAATGIYPLDVDGDGRVDLAVLRVGENLLLRGTGDCRFERANERWGFHGGDAWTTAFAAFWEPGRALPTLAVGNYVDRSAPGAPWGTCHGNELHRPAASAEGEAPPRYGPPLPLEPGYCALSMRASDWNRDGTPDLWVSNDRQYYLGGAERSGREQLWRIAPGAAPHRYTEAEGWSKLQIWGMGIAAGDVTGDGLPEFFLTSMADNKLRILEEGASGPAYRDAAFARGVTAHRPFTGDDTRPSTGWHAQFDDVDQDGFLDLFIAKGNVEAMPQFAADDPNNLLVGEPDGSFEERAEAAGIVSFASARGAQLVDLNADGRLDLVVVNREAPVQLWRHAGTDGAAVTIDLRQPGPNGAAVGAWLEVIADGRTMLRERFVGGGHASGTWGPTHVGVGDAEQVRVRVQWPDGAWQAWHDLPVGSAIELTRGADEARIAPLASPPAAGTP